MNIGNIISGHLNEFFGLNKDLVLERKKICKKCPLYTIKLGFEVCNSSLYLNTETGEISTKKKNGFKKGCGCRLNAKLTIPTESCPLNKW